MITCVTLRLTTKLWTNFSVLFGCLYLSCSMVRFRYIYFSIWWISFTASFFLVVDCMLSKSSAIMPKWLGHITFFVESLSGRFCLLVLVSRVLHTKVCRPVSQIIKFDFALQLNQIFISIYMVYGYVMGEPIEHFSFEGYLWTLSTTTLNVGTYLMLSYTHNNANEWER